MLEVIGREWFTNITFILITFVHDFWAISRRIGNQRLNSAFFIRTEFWLYNFFMSCEHLLKSKTEAQGMDFKKPILQLKLKFNFTKKGQNCCTQTHKISRIQERKSGSLFHMRSSLVCIPCWKNYLINLPVSYTCFH